MSSCLMTSLSVFFLLRVGMPPEIKGERVSSVSACISMEKQFQRQVPCQWRSSAASFQTNYVQCSSDRHYIELVGE